jgi:protein-disulfide isomerase
MDADQSAYNGVPVGFTEEGFPYWGDPDAPVVVEEYSDYLCPFCGRHFQQTLPALLEQYGQGDQVKYVFRDFPIPSLHPTAAIGHQAAWCVGEQGPAAYWAMHDQLFQNQAQWSNLPDPTPILTNLAATTGVDMAAYEECMISGRTSARVQEGMAAAAKLGYNGTPTFRFVANNGEDAYTLVGAQPLATFQQWLDAMVSGEAPPAEEDVEPEPAELPFWANAEGLAPDPDRPGFTLAGDAYKGNSKALLAVVEFSDFQCPACRRHALEVQPTLDETFVDSGKILWVFKNLPLRIHPQAPVAAVAAECAGEQGQFWEMHHLLFEAQDQWAVDDPDPVLLGLAQQLDLDDDDEFETCLDSRQALERVLADLYDAQGVVNSTPNFVILHSGRGTLLSSSRPAEQFIALLRGQLESAYAAEPVELDSPTPSQ